MKKQISSLKRRIIFTFMWVSSLCVFTQNLTVSGIVTDVKDNPLIGVTIRVSGTTNGTITDMNGNFTLNDVPSGGALEVSYVGMETQTIQVAGRTTITVIMSEDNELLEEIVVVGYGIQKKVNMTGAVSAVDFSKSAESRPITSISAGLAGLSSGVYVSQSGGGRPGYDGATIRIRGQGTLNDNNPLVIIDGTVGNMEDVNPQDVASISVLKDAASSAIYGSRAANGVILITTKRGQSGDARITYSGQLIAQNVSNKLDIVSNYADYMDLINEAYHNTNPTTLKPFSTEKIQEWRNAGNSNPMKYPNTDWQDEVFTTGWMQNHTLSISGGNEKTKYLFSGNITNNPGVMENSKYERYNARVNVDTEIKKWLTVGVSAYGYAGKADIGTDAMNTVYSFTIATSPGMYLRSDDGRYGGMNNSEDDTQSANNNPLYQLNIKKGHIKTNKIVSRFYGRLTPIKDLSIETSYTYDFTDRFTYSQPVAHDIWNFYEDVIQQKANVRTSVANNNDKWYRNLADVVATYNFRVDQLDVTAMAGASQESYRKQWIYASAKDLVSSEATELDAASSEFAATGNYTDWAMHSYFGRLNLAWAQKYLLEMNVRRDGSSRFRSGSSRWGVFPSFSAAWRINEEGFMADTRNWLDQLKARASWGTLGNNAMPSGLTNDGNYLYLSIYEKANYPLNGELQQGVAQLSLSNAFLTWETAYTTNFGVDFTMLNQRLNGSVDYFIKKTKNILIDLPAPLVHGTSVIPATNAATVRNNGLEINLGWNDKIGEVSYNIGLNYTYVKNKVVKYKGDVKDIKSNGLLQEGHPILAAYVLSVDRIVQTDEDLALVQGIVDQNPNAFSAYGRPEKGDFLYKDTNSDGLIDDEDRITVGNGPNPTSTYGINLGVAWKGIDFSCLLQGIGGYKAYILGGWYQPTVRRGYMINQDIADGRWYEDRTDEASQPRLLLDGNTRNSRPSDHWVQDKSYMRVKNIQLGYTFSNRTSGKAMLQSLRIYTSIDNAFTFTKYKGLDPEIDGLGYPPLRQIAFGLNVTF